MDKRIFKGSEVGLDAPWVADLSGPDVVSPNCYHTFRTRWQAAKFVELVDDGMSTDEAAYHVIERSDAAAAMGRATSPAKTAAARRNAKKGGWPKGRARK